MKSLNKRSKKLKNFIKIKLKKVLTNRNKCAIIYKVTEREL